MKNLLAYIVVSMISSCVTYGTIYGKQYYVDYVGIDACAKANNVYTCTKEINYIAELKQ